MAAFGRENLESTAVVIRDFVLWEDITKWESLLNRFFDFQLGLSFSHVIGEVNAISTRQA